MSEILEILYESLIIINGGSLNICGMKEDR